MGIAAPLHASRKELHAAPLPSQRPSMVLHVIRNHFGSVALGALLGRGIRAASPVARGSALGRDDLLALLARGLRATPSRAAIGTWPPRRRTTPSRGHRAIAWRWRDRATPPRVTMASVVALEYRRCTQRVEVGKQQAT